MSHFRYKEYTCRHTNIILNTNITLNTNTNIILNTNTDIILNTNTNIILNTNTNIILNTNIIRVNYQLDANICLF